MPKNRTSGCTMSRCCPVKQFLLSMRPRWRSSSAITGAILMASGRVPNTVSVLSIAQRAGVQIVFDRPADLPAGDIFRALAVATEETAGSVLQPLEVAQSAVGACALAEP